MENKSQKIKSMFDSIASAYDFLNRTLSFGRDSYWRKTAVEKTAPKNGQKILDLACGTADMMIRIKKTCPGCTVIGGDFSVNMLFRGKEKMPDGIFAGADATALPFKNDSFDAVTMAFGFRNVTEKEKGLSELHRVVKPGGKVCILEFSQPENRLFTALYRFYFTKILPAAGGFVSGNRAAYAYLPDSVYKFPKKEEYKNMILQAGFNNVSFYALTFGIVNVALINK